MSYTCHSAKATCKITAFESTEAVALSVYDYLMNHTDEIPEGLEDYDSDDVVLAIQSYLALEDDTLTISYSTEDEGNFDSQIFDFLSSHFAYLQASLFMQVAWVVDDSRDGYTSGTDYYDRRNKRVDVEALLTAQLSPITAGDNQ